MLTPQERTLRAKIGAFSLHAEGKTNTLPARTAFLSRFETQVDPQNTLPIAERQRRAECARHAYFLKLALKSAQARRRRAAKGASDDGS